MLKKIASGIAKVPRYDQTHGNAEHKHHTCQKTKKINAIVTAQGSCAGSRQHAAASSQSVASFAAACSQRLIVGKAESELLCQPPHGLGAFLVKHTIGAQVHERHTGNG